MPFPRLLSLTCIVIFGALLLVNAGVVAAEDNKDQGCINLSGKCIDTTKNICGGELVTNKCSSNSADYLCCLGGETCEIKEGQNCCTVTGSNRTICRLQNPLITTDVPTLIGIVISSALGVVGALALLMFFWGGFNWLTSAGAADKVETGTKTMLWAAIGLLVVFSSYLILNIVLRILTTGNVS